MRPPHLTVAPVHCAHEHTDHTYAAPLAIDACSSNTCTPPAQSRTNRTPDTHPPGTTKRRPSDALPYVDSLDPTRHHQTIATLEITDRCSPPLPPIDPLACALLVPLYQRGRLLRDPFGPGLPHRIAQDAIIRARIGRGRGVELSGVERVRHRRGRP